jgi:MFS superfamily sulfate permease-like transporter
VVAVVLLSLLLVAQRAARPRTTLLVRVPGTESFRGEGTEGGQSIPGMVLYRFESPLFFANADQLRSDVEAAVAAADPPARWVVIDCQAITSVDSTATAMLGDLVASLQAGGITVALARLSRPVAEYLDRAGILDAIGRHNIHLEVDGAVAAATG